MLGSPILRLDAVHSVTDKYLTVLVLVLNGFTRRGNRVQYPEGNPKAGLTDADWVEGLSASIVTGD